MMRDGEGSPPLSGSDELPERRSLDCTWAVLRVEDPDLAARVDLACLLLTEAMPEDLLGLLLRNGLNRLEVEERAEGLAVKGNLGTLARLREIVGRRR